MLKKLIFITLILICIMGLNAMEPEKKELIFGGYQWNCNFKGFGPNITVFDQWCGEGIVGYIQGDFNDSEDLDTKLQDDFYDLMIFDVDTVRYTQWGVKQLAVLYKKLKKGGKLILDFEFHPTDCFGSGEEVDTYEKFTKLFDDYLKSHPDSLINGWNCVKIKKPKDWDAFWDKYSKTVQKHNETVLKTVFKDNVKVFPTFRGGPARKNYQKSSKGESGPHYEATK
jgi:hypothetical protein